MKTSFHFNDFMLFHLLMAELDNGIIIVVRQMDT